MVLYLNEPPDHYSLDGSISHINPRQTAPGHAHALLTIHKVAVLFIYSNLSYRNKSRKVSKYYTRSLLSCIVNNDVVVIFVVAHGK